MLFAEEGAAVVCADVADAGIRETAARIEGQGGRAALWGGRCLCAGLGGGAVAFQCDVAQPAEVRALVACAEETFGGLHVLFNNAGVMLDGAGDAEGTEDAGIDRTWNVNVKGGL